MRALSDMGYAAPTPVQAQAIPHILAGKDVLATAQTGTGKTAAFALPLLSQMIEGKTNRPTLIVAPTRELAEQIGSVLVELTAHARELRVAVIIGGSSYPRQIRALRTNPAFVVGTPGRLIDQVRLGHLKLGGFGTLVMDEADRMLDMGFEPQMNELIAHLPRERQGLLFSATLPPEILKLANSYLRAPVRVAIGAVSKPVERIRQDVIQTTAKDKDETLIREIDKVAGSVLIFTKTKWKTEKLAKFLDKAGHDVARIHGDRSQNQRSNAIKEFREGRVRILVATDIAARGLDIPHIEHVVNYDLPMCPEDYIHRIGRTARGLESEGHSIAFVTPEERQTWARIHKLMHGKFPDSGSGEPHGGIQPRTFNRSERREGLPQNQNKKFNPRYSRGGDSRSRTPDSQSDSPARGRFGRESDRRRNRHNDSPLPPRRQDELRAEQFLKKEKEERRAKLGGTPSHSNSRPNGSHSSRPHGAGSRPQPAGPPQQAPGSRPHGSRPDSKPASKPGSSNQGSRSGKLRWLEKIRNQDRARS